MALQIKAIEHLFARLNLYYGKPFLAQWGVIDEDKAQAIKTMWSSELSVFSGNLEAIAWALDNLPPRAPNVIEFKLLCRQAPRPATPQLPEPPADPERMREALAKLGGMKAVRAPSLDSKDWAKRIVAREASGEIVNHTIRKMAHDALRLGTVLEVPSE